MPYKTWGCSICGAQAPKHLREHGNFAERMAWLRRHRKAKHPVAHKKSTKKAVRARTK